MGTPLSNSATPKMRGGCIHTSRKHTSKAILATARLCVNGGGNHWTVSGAQACPIRPLSASCNSTRRGAGNDVLLCCCRLSGNTAGPGWHRSTSAAHASCHTRAAAVHPPDPHAASTDEPQAMHQPMEPRHHSAVSMPPYPFGPRSCPAETHQPQRRNPPSTHASLEKSRCTRYKGTHGGLRQHGTPRLASTCFTQTPAAQSTSCCLSLPRWSSSSSYAGQSARTLCAALFGRPHPDQWSARS